MKICFSSETQLVASLKRGEPIAFRVLFNSYHQRLCVYACSFTNDQDLAADIVQNVFINVWKNRKKLEEKLKLKSYLYRCVYNQFIDQYRKKKPFLSLDSKRIAVISSVVQQEENEQLKKRIAIVKKEIKNLPPKCRETFLLSKREGLSNLEIAQYRNVSVKSVEAQITKAFHLIRKKVAKKTG